MSTNENLVAHNINEENALNMINSIISEFIKIYEDRIWGVYHSSLDENMKRVDIHLKRSIEVNLKEYKNNISISITVTSTSKIWNFFR